MKFGENLQGHITHEWRTQYIDYERLKDVLYEFKENAPAEDSVEKSEIERYFQQSSESFFQEIEKELQKVNLFFGEKLNEAARRFTQLKNDVEFYQKAEERAKSKAKTSKTNVQSNNQNGVRRRISANSSVSPKKILRIGKTDKNSIKTIKELKLACTDSTSILYLSKTTKNSILLVSGKFSKNMINSWNQLLVQNGAKNMLKALPFIRINKYRILFPKQKQFSSMIWKVEIDPRQ